MVTTPLRTASRALSISTLMVAGFAAWVLSTQGSVPRGDSASSPQHERAVSFEVIKEKSPVANSQESIAQTTRNQSPDERAVHSGSAPRFEGNTILDDEFPKPGRIVGANTKPRSSHLQTVPRIQPEMGRRSTGRDALIVAPKAFDEFDPFSDELDAQLQSPRILDRSSGPIRPVDGLPESESGRVESQLTALQKKIDQLAQAQNDQKSGEVQQAIEALQQIQESKQNEKFEKLLQQLQDSLPSAAAPTKEPGSKTENVLPNGAKPEDSNPKPSSDSLASEKPTADKPGGTMRFEPAAGKQDRFDHIDFDDVDISKALSALGQLSGMNILVGRDVIGKVPAANLQNVSAEEALDAITKSLGYVYERDGNFVYVWTATDSLARQQAARKTVSKVFRPRYVSVKDLQTLITPMLSKPAGLIAVTTPSEMGLEESKSKVGGNSLAQTDALLVVDYPEVIAQIEIVIADIDVPPAQVVIEAMILSVNLTDTMKLGVNFALLNGDKKQLVTVGNGSQLNSNVGFNKDTLLPVAGDFVASTAGLKYGFINGDLAGFVEALETLAETSVVASPSVRVLNKQKAELIIGQRLGYKTTTFNGTQSIENINFLEVGTKLLLRPFVAEDGLVRMEIHPERSDGTISDTGLPSSRTTEVTSNVMVRDGTTIVIGGLIEEQANQAQSRVPLLGALPVVGNLFKNKSNDTTRTELIVLITPRIIHDPVAESEGDLSRAENERRHQYFRDKLSPINRHNLARVEYERAARYFEEGDAPRAKRHIDESLRHDRNDKDSLRLRDQITAVIDDKNWFKKLRRKPPTVYHSNPSSPTVPQNDAYFEVEQVIPARPGPLPFPPAPAAIPGLPRSPADDSQSPSVR